MLGLNSANGNLVGFKTKQQHYVAAKNKSTLSYGVKFKRKTVQSVCMLNSEHAHFRTYRTANLTIGVYHYFSTEYSRLIMNSVIISFVTSFMLFSFCLKQPSKHFFALACIHARQRTVILEYNNELQTIKSTQK